MVQTRTADRPHWPLPRTRTTQLYGDRRRQGPVRRGTGTSTTRYGDRSPLFPSPVLFQSLEEEPGGSRPALLPEVAGWQATGSAARRGASCGLAPLVQNSRCSCARRWWTARWISFVSWILPVTEQVVEVPKVSSSSCPLGAVLHEPQLVEQLVEVPTVLSVAELQQRTAEPARQHS